jgi:alpha-1,3-glucosyltransferase
MRYRNTTDNDLQYWGLDYPPLTAIVSYGFGSLAHQLYPDLVILHKSRGHESALGKLFMRSSVILCDLLILFPALAYFAMAIIGKKKHLQQKDYQSIALFFLTSCLPCLLLIDHGHFQYNGVSIGLALLGATELLQQRYLLGSFYFSLALNFKQMLLYYAPVFFFALLRKCYESGLKPSSPASFDFTSALWQLFLIGSTVLLTFAALWLPFCFSLSFDHTCPQTLLEILTRLFPFSRGIFEDKVANIWYTLSVPFDFRTMADTASLVRASLLLTLFFLTPVAISLLSRPLTSLLIAQSLVLSSLAFFLASFQVHEKSLLLSLVPAAFLFPLSPEDMLWFQISGTMTLFPLLIKDGHRIPYWCTLLLYLSLVMLTYHKKHGVFSPPQHNFRSTLAPYPSWLQWVVTVTRWLYYGISITGLVPSLLPTHPHSILL